MAIQKITIEEFLKLAKQYPVLDVRSPGEYTHAHIPRAYNLPLFSDEERKQVGTIYKQQSREAAIKIGLDFFGAKMRKMVEETETIVSGFSFENPKQNEHINDFQGSSDEHQETRNVLVHCWRGGMRSAAVAWLLDMYGFKVYLLVGGYKAYRKWVLTQFEKEYSFKIIGGYTGSGKTLLLHALQEQDKKIIDLEALANHKGSAFGAMQGKPQPKQEMFENLLAESLFIACSSLTEAANGQRTTDVYIEDESQRIGNLQIPMPLWKTMRRSPVYFLDIPFPQRLKYITKEYGGLEKEYLEDAILRIQKRLGGLEAKNAINHLHNGKPKDCFRILLTYYDKWYLKGLNNRENLSSLLNKIPCTGVDTGANTQKLLSCNIVSV